MTHKIDFVIPWVDGNESKWQKEFAKYSNKENLDITDKQECRYRDWDLMRYWFRGVEKFAPWVNKVHFITCGHVPEWLNLDHHKLNWVKHSDYIPEEWLPTFSSHPIELNIHRIKDLGEHFVYFNDDLFLIDNVKPENFFYKEKPCDMAVIALLAASGIAHIELNDIKIINNHFDIRKVLKTHFGKWFNVKYGRFMCVSLLLSMFPYFEEIKNFHMPIPLLKSTFNEVWEKCEQRLEETSASKFRSINDINIWLMREWQLASGKFHPYNVCKDGVYYEVANSNIGRIENEIISHKKKVIVLNDVGGISAFNEIKQRLHSAFEQILPEKSSFEL